MKLKEIGELLLYTIVSVSILIGAIFIVFSFITEGNI
jgi:hypothetical protein